MANQYDVLGKAPGLEELNKLSPSDVHLTIRGLNAGYGKMEILHNFDLTVSKGQSLCLIGPNGAGKSTILHSIYGFTNIFDGKIELEGNEITKLTPAEKLSKVGVAYILQDNSVFPDMTVEENLLLPMELNGESAKIAKTRVAQLMQELGLEDRLESFPDRLSGGEQQRVAIARALIHDPNLVLADEPTGNLDRQTGEQALRLFRELIRKAGTTMIVATHSSEVLGIADRVISLEEGKLVENDAPN